MVNGIPRIDIAALFDGDHNEQPRIDSAVARAAREIGFMTVSGLPAGALLDADGWRRLTAIFDLTETQKVALYRQKFAPANTNLYRGFLPAAFAAIGGKEQMDIGPDLADEARPGDVHDVLKEPTPCPPDAVLPGWREAVGAYYLAAEAVAFAVLGALARGLGLDEEALDQRFRGGISTLRLLRYPLPGEADESRPDLIATHDGVRRHLAAPAHCDTGFLTILRQDMTGGLQVKRPGGGWIDVPPDASSLVVNFGQLLEVETGACATPHRVLDLSEGARARYSIPFFFEPRAEALIQPLGGNGADGPVRYGDYLWDAMQRFPEFEGLGDTRFS